MSRLPKELHTEAPIIKRRTDFTDLINTTPACHVGNISRQGYKHKRIANAKGDRTACPTPPKAILVGSPVQSSLNVQKDQKLSKFTASE